MNLRVRFRRPIHPNDKNKNSGLQYTGSYIIVYVIPRSPIENSCTRQ